MMAVKFILGLLLVFALITFAVNNQQDVTVSYYFGYAFDMKLWVSIMASFAIGALLASIMVGFSLMKAKSRGWSLARKAAKLEEELNALKQKPLPDEPAVYPAPEPQSPALVAADDVRALPSQAAAPKS